MAVKVIGKRIASFTDKKTGEVVMFGKVFVAYPDSTMQGLVGEVAESISMKPELVQEISVGSEITVIYNKYGKAEDFTVKKA